MKGNIENIGMEEIGVKKDRGWIVIEGYGKKNVEGIYEIGDVEGKKMMEKKEENEGVIWVEKIEGMKNVNKMEMGKIKGWKYWKKKVE